MESQQLPGQSMPGLCYPPDGEVPSSHPLGASQAATHHQWSKSKDWESHSIRIIINPHPAPWLFGMKWGPLSVLPEITVLGGFGSALNISRRFVGCLGAVLGTSGKRGGRTFGKKDGRTLGREVGEFWEERWENFGKRGGRTLGREVGELLGREMGEFWEKRGENFGKRDVRRPCR